MKNYNPSSPPVACYDLRVSVALEQDLALPTDTSQLPLPNYKTRRDKQRRSYRKRDDGGLWVTDLTYVSAQRNEQYQGCARIFRQVTDFAL